MTLKIAGPAVKPGSDSIVVPLSRQPDLKLLTKLTNFETAYTSAIKAIHLLKKTEKGLENTTNNEQKESKRYLEAMKADMDAWEKIKPLYDLVYRSEPVDKHVDVLISTFLEIKEIAEKTSRKLLPEWRYFWDLANRKWQAASGAINGKINDALELK